MDKIEMDWINHQVFNPSMDYFFGTPSLHHKLLPTNHLAWRLNNPFYTCLFIDMNLEHWKEGSGLKVPDTDPYFRNYLSL